MMQNFQFHFGLLMKTGLIANDLDSSHNLVFKVKALQHLSKGTLAQYTDNLKSVCQVVMDIWLVIPAFVVEAKIQLTCTLTLL
jgi:hypothetical protein